MHAEPACGFGDVEIGLDQGRVDAFPFQRFDRGRAGADLDVEDPDSDSDDATVEDEAA